MRFEPRRVRVAWMVHESRQEEAGMKLSVQDVAKKTGLSISTVRQYAWRMKIGKKEGTKKFFTLDEAKKIGSGSAPKTVKKSKTKSAKKSPAGKRKR